MPRSGLRGCRGRTFVPAFGVGFDRLTDQLPPKAPTFASGLFSFDVAHPMAKSRSRELYEKAEE